MKKIPHTECKLCKEILDLKTKKQEKVASNKESKTKNVQSVVENFSQLNKTIKKGNGLTVKNTSEEEYTGKSVYSEGEVSSNYKVNSSVDSKEVELISLSDENEFQKELNDFVEFKNKLARQKKENEKKYFVKDKSMSRRRYTSEEKYVNDSSKEKNKVKIYNEEKYHQDLIQSKGPNYVSRIRSREKEDYNTTEQHIFCDRRRSSDRRGKSRYLSREKTFSSSGSRSTERSTRSRSPFYKLQDKTSRCSESYEKSNSKLSQSTSPRKRRLSPHSESTSFFVQKKLNERRSPSSGKNRSKNSSSSPVTNPYKDQSKKKERNPFLVNLEHKEQETSKNSKKESVKQQMKKGSTQASESNENSKNLSTLQADAASCHTPVPKVGIDNMPSVSKPTGLPAHVITAGEQIPPDITKRQILLSPNSRYPSPDPTDPLFSSIVPPGNQAVPAPLTVENIMRLPNSNPDPDCPNQQFLVDVNKSVINIKSNSTSLLPKSYLPSTAPLHLRSMVSSSQKVDNGGVQQTIPATGVKQTETQKTIGQSDFQSLEIDDTSTNSIMDSPRNVRNRDFSYNYKKRFREKNQDILKYLATQIQLRVDRSSGGEKTSPPVQPSLDKNSRDGTCSSGFNVDLKSGDLDLLPSGLIHKSKRTKVPSEEIVLHSDNKQDKKITKTVINIKKDPVTSKVLQMFKLLREKNYQPPTVGRFIIYNPQNFVQIKFPNESPLSKNRVKLPFLTPNFKNVFQLENPTEEEKSVVALSYSLQKKFQTQVHNKNSHKTKLPVIRLDVGVQCDLTKIIIRALKIKITELEKEMTRLRRVNETVQIKKRKGNDLEKNAAENSG